MSSLEALQQKIQYTFSDVDLLVRALTHRSAKNDNNERLEFLGDAVLNFLIADLLYHQFGRAHEGQLTRLRSSLVKEATLAQLANEFELSRYIILGPGEKKSGGFRRDSILADCVEAILGAIYQDSDFDTCSKVLRSWYAPRLQNLNLNIQKDAKTSLQEWLQARQLPLPDYEVLKIEGKPHDQVFTVVCKTEDFPEGFEGSAKSRRIAEQVAADKLLQKLKEGCHNE